MLKKKLEEKGIQYDVFSSVEDMLNMGIKEVPILKVNNKGLPFKEAVDWIKEQ